MPENEHFLATIPSVMRNGHQVSAHTSNSLVSSKMDYGCLVYQSVTKILLRILTLVYNLGIYSLATGAYRTIPIPSLRVEPNQLFLPAHQRTYMALMYAAKIISMKEHPLGTLL